MLTSSHLIGLLPKQSSLNKIGRSLHFLFLMFGHQKLQFSLNGEVYFLLISLAYLMNAKSQPTGILKISLLREYRMSQKYGA